MPTFFENTTDESVEEEYKQTIVQDKPSDTKFKLNRALGKTIGRPISIISMLTQVGLFMEIVLAIGVLIYMIFGNSKDPIAIRFIFFLILYIIFTNFRQIYKHSDILEYDKHPELLNKEAILEGRVPCTVSSKYAKHKAKDLVSYYYISNGKDIFEVSEAVYELVGRMGILFYEGDPIDYDINAWSIYIK